jgi:catechol 2,3-dioxygenase-like lactoylglutathione lyase family enzyme
MPLRGLDHINIGTSRLEVTKRFFIVGLGLSEGWRPPFPFGGAWLYLEGRAVVHLVEKAVDLRPSIEAALDHFAFEAVGYDETVERLQAAEVSFGAVDVPGSKIRQLFVQDPNGVRIELNFQGD